MIRVLSLYDSSPNVSSSAIASSNACSPKECPVKTGFLKAQFFKKPPRVAVDILRWSEERKKR
jgi:hypothetical protein